jgi:NAD(P)-dependent dehydrogenase (short-subunit alcohol dehydrogenase family)
MSNGSVLDCFSLHGKTALVTGAGQGIGRAIAQTLANAGAMVGCLDRNAQSLQETVDLIQQDKGMALALVADVSSQEQTQAAVDKLGGHSNALHILINGAAAADPSGTVVDYSLTDWNQAIAVNLTGAFLMSKAAIPAMVRSGGGSVVLVASQLGHVGSPRRAVYCAIKGGLLNLARAMAIDHAPDRIRVNTLSPGAIETDRMLIRFGTMEAAREVLAPLHLSGRLGTVDEIAMAALYLASDASSFMTGADMLVDGGYTAH